MPPAPIAVTPLSRPATRVGVVVYPVADPIPVLLPSWPYWLLPQQYTPPVLVTAHVCAAPAVTFAHDTPPPPL